MLEQALRNSRLVAVVKGLIGKGGATSISGINQRYDEQTVEVMRRVLAPDANCIDVGAHQGSVLKDMVALAPAGHHHAFEALPHLAAALREAFPEVAVHEIAVSDSAGDAEFQYVVNSPGYSGLRKRIYDRTDPQIQKLQVSMATIDSIIDVGQPIGLIKIDIEGGEYHALRGAAQTILRTRPVIVFEAGAKSTGQYGVTPDAMFSLITEEFGYTLSTMERWLADKPAYTRDGFVRNWSEGADFYFIATPAATEGLQ